MEHKNMPLQFCQLNSMASEVTSKTTWFESVHCLQKKLNYIQLTYFSFQNVQSRLLYFKFSNSFNESRLSQLHSISGSILKVLLSEMWKVCMKEYTFFLDL